MTLRPLKLCRGDEIVDADGKVVGVIYYASEWHMRNFRALWSTR